METLARMPKQNRSHASFERVLEAATALLQERGYEDFTLNEVSRRSGVSIGSIYGRVDSKDALIRTVQARALVDIDEKERRVTDSARWQGYGLDRLVPGVVSEFGEFLKENSPLLRAFMVRAPMDPVIAQTGKRSHEAMAVRFETLLLSRRNEISHPEPERAVHACFAMAYASYARYLGLGSAMNVAGEGDWTALKGDISLMTLCFLKYRPAP
ncbi:TetR/AcrR family transcriptional regulator [Nitrospirillum sp. BR 11164]|uniref:TetR/AcrR family transcriptional regulator n=1 Tax=Nitrospirillum sp. BR 11164 TaxID=3104324 RepID=UPI002AFF283F|nr:TetR/AcrR family transcriptional regulator [Nitrospirillum sp. BR 11164]MEA1652799.1 TetR/AcrR family transcriptional regulator [Nitrospirillum sp. BR 11164]